MSCFSTAKHRKTTLIQVAEAEIWSHQKPNPQHSNTQLGEIAPVQHLSQKRQGGTPTSGISTKKTSPQNTWLGKTMKQMSKRPKVL